MQENRNQPNQTSVPHIITSSQQQPTDLPLAPIPQSDVQPMIVGAAMPMQPVKKLKRSRKILILACAFLLFASIGFGGHKLLQNTQPTPYRNYTGKGSFSFEYPKGWILKEEDTTSQKYGSYKVTISTSDYTAQTSADDLTETTTKGYRFTIFNTKNDGIIKDTNGMFEYLSSEKAKGLKKLETPNKIVLVQSVGQPSAFTAYNHNSSTISFFTKNNYDYSLSYDYPDKKDFTPDNTYMQQYNHLLSTFTEK